MKTRFVYEDTLGTKHGLTVNGGLVLEDLPITLAAKFVSFVVASSESFYRKYPQCRTTPERNGFVENLLLENERVQNNIGNGEYWARVKQQAGI